MLDKLTIEDIKSIGRQYGQDHNLGSDLGIEDVYPAIAGKMLNGMPCDRVEEMLDSTEDSFRWRDRLDIHADYWEPYGRSSKDFYQINFTNFMRRKNNNESILFLILFKKLLLIKH